MNPNLIFEQSTVALQRMEFIEIFFGVLAIGLVAVWFYLLFGRVLIPVARSLCNFLDAKAWNIDHQNKSRPGQEPESDSRDMPNT